MRLSELQSNPFQPRSDFDPEALQALAESIQRSGLLQPIAVRIAPQGGWQVIAGERRWRAAELVGLTEIPALVCQATDREAAEYALVENLQREDLNPLERAKAFRSLIDSFGLSQADAAQGAGVGRATVANLLRVLELEPEIQELLQQELLTLGHAKALLMASAGNSRIEGARRMANEGWSVRQAEQWGTRESSSGPRRAKKGKSMGEHGKPNAEVERQLGDHLGTRVRIRTKGDGQKGVLMIDFYNLEQFDGLMDRVGFSMMS